MKVTADMSSHHGYNLYTRKSNSSYTMVMWLLVLVEQSTRHTLWLYGYWYW